MGQEDADNGEEVKTALLTARLVTFAGLATSCLQGSASMFLELQPNHLQFTHLGHLQRLPTPHQSSQPARLQDVCEDPKSPRKAEGQV